MREDLLGSPTAAEIMADEGVKDVAAVGAARGSGAHDLLDLIDTIAAAVAVEGIAVDRLPRLQQLPCGARPRSPPSRAPYRYW